MEELDELLMRMHALIDQASCMSTDLAGFISAESLPLGEIMRDWLSSRRASNVCITQEETDQLIERRRAATWAKAEQKFAQQELILLADWQALEAKAVTLSINRVLENSCRLAQG